MNREWWRPEVWITRQTVAVMTSSPLWLGAQRTRIPWNSTRHVTQKLYLVCFMCCFNAAIALEVSRDVDLQIKRNCKNMYMSLNHIPWQDCHITVVIHSGKCDKSCLYENVNKQIIIKNGTNSGNAHCSFVRGFYHAVIL